MSKIVFYIGVFIICLPVWAEKPFKKIEKLHCFSNPVALDTFRLSYHSLDKQDVITFDIISSEGKLIFHERFFVWALNDDLNPFYHYYTMKGWKKEKYYTNYQDSIHVTDSLKRAEHPYILSRINQFFNENYFTSNPVTPLHDKFPELLVKGSYEEFLKDTTTIGFTFRLAEENIRGIAYSKKKKKVVVYYTCC